MSGKCCAGAGWARGSVERGWWGTAQLAGTVIQGSGTSDIRRRLARRVRLLRAARGWSQEVLAELAGLHRNYIGYVERGTVNVGLENLAKLAAAFQVSVGELVGDGQKSGRGVIS